MIVSDMFSLSNLQRHTNAIFGRSSCKLEYMPFKTEMLK